MEHVFCKFFQLPLPSLGTIIRRIAETSVQSGGSVSFDNLSSVVGEYFAKPKLDEVLAPEISIPQQTLDGKRSLAVSRSQPQAHSASLVTCTV